MSDLALPPLLSPLVCGTAWCRREARCFQAAMGGSPCRERPGKPQPDQDRLLRSIGHRPNSERPGYGFRRAPTTHRTSVAPPVFELLVGKQQPFLILPHDQDFRVGDALLIQCGNRSCTRIITCVAQHEALREGWVALGLMVR